MPRGQGHRRRRLAPRVGPALALSLLFAGGSAWADEPARSWATSQAIERTRIGREHAAQGDADGALRAYHDAIVFDATYGPAYLALGELCEARGDVVEADRAFSMGIEHVAGFDEGFVARGKLRVRVHHAADAIADFEAAAALRPEGLGILRQLCDAYIAARALPAALAVARRRVLAAEAQGDTRAAAEARAMARALAGLVAEVDPVTAGGHGRGPVRRALWASVQRR